MEQNFESGTNILADCDRTPRARRKYSPWVQRVVNLLFKKEETSDRTNERLLELLRPMRNRLREKWETLAQKWNFRFKLIRAKYGTCIVQRVTAEKKLGLVWRRKLVWRKYKSFLSFPFQNGFFLPGFRRWEGETISDMDRKWNLYLLCMVWTSFLITAVNRQHKVWAQANLTLLLILLGLDQLDTSQWQWIKWQGTHTSQGMK